MIIKNIQKGFIVQGIIAVVALVLIAGGVYYVMPRKSVAPIDIIHPEIVSKYPELIDDVYMKTKSEIIPDTISTICKNDSVTEVNYKTKTNKYPNVMGGDWVNVNVIDCGDSYWITNLSDSGPKLYGPFDLAKTTIPKDKSSITVLSPNGGEKINLDQNYEIKWKNTDVESGGSIYISPKGKDMDKGLVVDRFAFKAQSYAWKTGEVFSSDFKSRVKVASGEYKIGVCLTKYVNNKSVEECDWSDSYFSIIN